MEKYLITTGHGNSKFALNAFDNALLASGIADYNLVKLSSILPARCQRVNALDLPKGTFLHTAYATHTEERIGVVISAAVAIAIPKDRSLSGVIMKASGELEPDEANEMACSMARIAMDARGINEYDIENEAVSVKTTEGYNCVIAAVSIW